MKNFIVMFRKIFTFLIISVFCILLSSCGKKEVLAEGDYDVIENISGGTLRKNIVVMGKEDKYVLELSATQVQGTTSISFLSEEKIEIDKKDVSIGKEITVEQEGDIEGTFIYIHQFRFSDGQIEWKYIEEQEGEDKREELEKQEYSILVKDYFVTK